MYHTPYPVYKLYGKICWQDFGCHDYDVMILSTLQTHWVLSLQTLQLKSLEQLSNFNHLFI